MTVCPKCLCFSVPVCECCMNLFSYNSISFFFFFFLPHAVFKSVQFPVTWPLEHLMFVNVYCVCLPDEHFWGRKSWSRKGEKNQSRWSSASETTPHGPLYWSVMEWLWCERRKIMTFEVDRVFVLLLMPSWAFLCFQMCLQTMHMPFTI